jgi:hypothetical protein
MVEFCELRAETSEEVIHVILINSFVANQSRHFYTGAESTGPPWVFLFVS